MNFLPPFGEATTARSCGLSVDSANYEPTFDRALEMVGYDAAARGAAAHGATAATSQQLGIGLSTLHRDVRARALEHPRRAAIRGRRLGRAPSRVPARRQGRRADRHVAARAGARDDVVADRGRRARRDARRHRGAARRHGGVAARHGHVRLPLGERRRRRPSHFALEKIARKARTIAAHELEVAEDDLELDRRRVPRAGRARQGADDPRDRGLGVARA